MFAKLAKNASGVFQALDIGDIHMYVRQGCKDKKCSLSDVVPTLSSLKPFYKAWQELRDQKILYVDANKYSGPPPIEILEVEDTKKNKPWNVLFFILQTKCKSIDLVFNFCF